MEKRSGLHTPSAIERQKIPAAPELKATQSVRATYMAAMQCYPKYMCGSVAPP